MRFYTVTYTRNMHGSDSSKRLIASVRVSEHDLKLMLEDTADDSRNRFIILSAVLVTEDYVKAMENLYSPAYDEVQNADQEWD